MINKQSKLTFWLIFALLAGLQIIVMSQFGLFGDEAFYWLEGQHLAWSYAELPGFTAWQLAFSEWLFPHQPIFLRLIPWLAALSLPFAARAISRLIHPDSNTTQAAYLLWSLPLFGLVSILALPDIWLLFFTVWSVFCLLAATKSNHLGWFIALGFCLALGINVHLRFWLFAGLLGMSTLWFYRHKKATLTKLLTISLPIALVGLLPILWFNLQHDFPLLAFQLKDRHPWSFQLDHLYFIPIQLLVCTPLVLALWFKLIPISKNQWSALKTEQKLITAAALSHWLLYFILGFFSDNLRLNLHWPLLSYALLFFCYVEQKPKWLTRWAIKTGMAAHVLLLLTLLYWSQQSLLSEANHNLTKHAQGWVELAKETEKTMQKHAKTKILADHFMTTAQLSYQFNQQTEIKTLEHPLSQKHGRDLQLEIMGYRTNYTDLSSSLIILEHSALKLQDQVSFYQNLCQKLGGLKLLSQFNSRKGNKIYHYFEQNKGQCDMPSLFYAANNKNKLSGWLLTRKDDLENLTLNVGNTDTDINFEPQSVIGNEIFSALNPKEYSLNTFETIMPTSCLNCSYQLKASLRNGQQHSQRFYP